MDECHATSFFDIGPLRREAVGHTGQNVLTDEADEPMPLFGGQSVLTVDEPMPLFGGQSVFTVDELMPLYSGTIC